MKKRVLKVSLVLVLIIGAFVLFNNRINKIDKILETSSYSYLPVEAKNYIRNVYEKTGQIVLTEKNKEDNKPYLNPKYIDYLTASSEEKMEYGDIPISQVVDYSITHVETDYELESKYDLRDDNDYNYVTPVRDQGDLGICWTFASAGAMESHLLKKSNTSYNSKSTLIAERQIDYMTSKDGISDYNSEYVTFIDRSLGSGGNFFISSIALGTGVSAYKYSSFKPYNDKDLSEMELYEVLDYKRASYEVNKTIIFPDMNLRESTGNLTEQEQAIRTSFIDDVKQNIMSSGAAYIGVPFDTKCIYTDDNDNTIMDVYHCGATAGHAMQIIGWDDDLEFNYCADTLKHNTNTTNCNNIVSGRGAWILKNSWGDTMPYLYLAYDSQNSTIGFIDEIVSTEGKNWDNDYILGDGEDFITSKTYTLDGSRIKGDEIIKKVKVIVANTYSTYNVRIKKKDNTYETIQQYSYMPGLITFDITGDIVVDENTEITIYGNGYFIDKVIVMTSNTDDEAYLDLTPYEWMTPDFNEFRLYSQTKNIESEEEIEYKLYDSNDVDLTNNMAVSNNIVAENNINTLIKLDASLDKGVYRIDAVYQSNVISSANINFNKMDGSGTSEDPYIITTTAQFYQIRDDLDAYYELGNDLDFTEDTSEYGKFSLKSSSCPQGFGWEAINNFSGSLDGKGYTIKGVNQNNYIQCETPTTTLTTWNNKGNGLFGAVNRNATIKNLVLEDFNINCQGGYCGLLVSNYVDIKDENGVVDYSDTTEYHAVFENIAVINGKMSGIYGGSSTSGGGLFGGINSSYGSVTISNIYLDINMTPNGLKNNAYLASDLSAHDARVKNIRLVGNLVGKYEGGNGDSMLVNEVVGNTPTYVENVLSTLTAKNVKSNLISNVYTDYLELNGINILNNEDKAICYSEGKCTNATNINMFDKDTEIIEFTKRENYQSWEDFDDDWIMETIDGIDRIPVLKFMNFEYTSINDININQVLNVHSSIYDYITPNTDAAKNIIYSSNDEDIVKFDEDGTIVPVSTGQTTIHVESLYDGYIKDVPISINYTPHYIVKFDANGGEGSMSDREILAGINYTIPDCTFTKTDYIFNGWNTNADGTGQSYDKDDILHGLVDKEEITLYAMWIGKEVVVYFDADGGEVSPNAKIVHYDETYGELPIPIKEGYGFGYWVKNNGVIIDSITKVNSTDNHTLIARWNENAYTLVYNSNGGELNEDNYYIADPILISVNDDKVITSVGFDEARTLVGNLFDKEHYILKEWNTKPDGTGISYQPNGVLQLSSIDEDVFNLYAIWEGDVVTITFNSNDENNINKTQELQYNVISTLEKNTFEREGYTFIGWNTEPDGSGTSYSDEDEIVLSSDITLYAQWQLNVYTITFYKNDGSDTHSTMEITHGIPTKINKNTFERDDYTFIGWNTEPNGSGTTYADEDEIMLSSDITLYAQWEKVIPYIISDDDYDINDDYIKNIEVNTTVDDYLDKFQLGINYTVDVDYKVVNNKQVLYTGGKTRIYKGQDIFTEFIVIVPGDTSGDGVINYLDYVNVYNHIQKIKHPSSNKKELKDEYLLAADMSKDSKISYLDYVSIYNKIKALKGGSN